MSTMITVRAARIVEINEDTEVPTGWCRHNVSEFAAHDIASRMYRTALKEGRDVYYKVEIYEVYLKATADAVQKFANSLDYV